MFRYLGKVFLWISWFSVEGKILSLISATSPKTNDTFYLHKWTALYLLTTTVYYACKYVSLNIYLLCARITIDKKYLHETGTHLTELEM